MKKMIVLVFLLVGCSKTEVKEVGYIEATDTPPIITIIGDSYITVEAGVDIYEELGATAHDEEDGTLQVEIRGDISNYALGTHKIVYSAVDKDGNMVESVRTVEVRDTTAPIILLEKFDIFVEKNTENFTLPYEVLDNSDEDIIVEIESNLNTEINGSYQLIVRAIDHSENMSEKKVSVHVYSEADIYENDLYKLQSYSLDFIQQRVPDLTDREYYKFVYIKENPEKGFNFPYIIELPSNEYIEENYGIPKYPLVQVSNLAGPFGGYEGKWNLLLNDQIYNNFYGQNSYGMELSKELYVPEINILVPQPCWQEEDTETTPRGGLSLFRTLNEESVRFEESVKRGIVNRNGNGCYVSESDEVYSFEELFDIESQILSILLDAQERLKEAGWNIEDKFFLYGYSNTGHFAKNFSAIYPEMVKAYYAGGSFESMLPVEYENGVKMTYPFGVGDYTQFFEKDFNRTAWDLVAKLHDQGIFDTDGGSGEDLGGVYSYLFNNYYDMNSSNKVSMFFNLARSHSIYGSNINMLLNTSKGHDITVNDSKLITDFFKMNRQFEEPVGYPSGRLDEYYIINTQTSTLEEVDRLINEFSNIDFSNEKAQNSYGVYYDDYRTSVLLQEVLGIVPEWNSRNLNSIHDSNINILFMIISESNMEEAKDFLETDIKLSLNNIISTTNKDFRIILIYPEDYSTLEDMLLEFPEQAFTEDITYKYSD